MSSALEYHDRTKHSQASLRASRHFLDWAIQPRPFKIYPTLAPIPLPRQIVPCDANALQAIAAPPVAPTDSLPNRTSLARLLHFTAGITRTRTYAGGAEAYFRAAACTGALYHIDVYLVCGDLSDLEAGVYHFGAHDFALRRLRGGDLRAVVIEATGGEAAVVGAPVLLICTSTFWRNSWKYQARTYRHCFWDSGTMLANLLAIAAADRVPVRIVLGFADAAVNHLLGLDTDREVALSIVAVGRRPAGTPESAHAASPPAAPALPPLRLETEPPSAREIDYPAIRAAHAGSSFERPEQAAAWRSVPWKRGAPPSSSETIPLLAAVETANATLGATIVRRGSTRAFAQVPISLAELSEILTASTGPVPFDFSHRAAGATWPSLNDVYLIVNAVDGLPAGTYAYRPGCAALEPLRRGDFRRAAGYLDLGQELGRDASVNFYFLSDLEAVVAEFGDRGYRAAQLEAAIMGGRIYLAAYALGLGATGLTFFDDDVTDFFSPHAAGKGVMFLVAVGRSRRNSLKLA